MPLALWGVFYFCAPVWGMTVQLAHSRLQGDVSCDFPVITRACCFLCAYLLYECVWDRDTEREFYFKPNSQSRWEDEAKDVTVGSVMWSSCYALNVSMCEPSGLDSSIDSVPTYLDWMLDALYSSHPNIIRAKPTMWFQFRMWRTHAWPVDVSLRSGPPWGKITFYAAFTELKVETDRKYIHSEHQ